MQAVLNSEDVPACRQVSLWPTIAPPIGFRSLQHDHGRQSQTNKRAPVSGWYTRVSVYSTLVPGMRNPHPAPTEIPMGSTGMGIIATTSSRSFSFSYRLFAYY